MTGYLNELDEIKRRLQEENPGWHVWYVPHADRTVAWCAQPWPLLNAASPEDLSADIKAAHAEAGEHWPALRFAPGTPIPWEWKS